MPLAILDNRFNQRVHSQPRRPMVARGPLRYMPADATGGLHLEYKVAALVVASLPIVAQMDTNNIAERTMLALCGGLGALLALLSDRPKSWQDVVFRIVGGIVSCFLFGPFLAIRFGMNADMNGIILTFGLTGVLSWYVLGAITKILIAWRDNGGLGNMLKLWVAKWAAITPPTLPPDRKS